MHVGMNFGTPNGVANPLDIKMKEADLDYKYDLEDSDHIYDNPNHLMESCLKMPLPPTTASYNTLNRETGTKALSSANTPTPYSQPTTEKGEGAMSKGSRYTSLQLVTTSTSSLTTANGTKKPKHTPPPVPPGYSAPRSLVSAGRATAPRPPGYAVPRPQSTEKVEPQPPATEKINLVEDGVTVQYFPLMRRERENSTYQALKLVPTKPDRTASHTQQDATTSHTQQVIEEEEAYMMMKSSQATVPEFPE